MLRLRRARQVHSRCFNWGEARPYGLAEASAVVDGAPIRSLTAGLLQDVPQVVFVPGLGAPGYLAPWVRETAAWTRATLLDLPGWRWGRARSCLPTLDGVAAATARWLEVHGIENVVLVGHSTGSQAVVRAALLAPERMLGVVLVGPTFDSKARSWPTLVGRALRTVLHEVSREVPAVLPAYLHSGGWPLLRFLLTAMGDEPERNVQLLECPVLIMTGEHDGFAPPRWAQRLAGLAAAPCVVLAGGHNFCFPHPRDSDAVLRRFVSHWANHD